MTQEETVLIYIYKMRGSDDLMNSQNCGASFPALSRFYMSCRSQLAFWSIVTSFTVSVPSDACWISAMLVLLSEVVYLSTFPQLFGWIRHPTVEGADVHTFSSRLYNDSICIY